MKIKRQLMNVFIVFIAVGFIAGCATTGYQKAANTSNTMTRASAAVLRGNVLIDETLVKLNDLVSNPSRDLQKQFAAFSHSVDELGLTAQDVTNKSEQMKMQGAEYFKDWDKEVAQIKNQDIRSGSEDRKREVSFRFDHMTRLYEETKAAFIPYMSDLRDVQRFLSVDLTIGGLAAIKDVVAQATAHAAPLKESIGKLSEEFQTLGFSMSSKTLAK